jgi:hypothetical protein
LVTNIDVDFIGKIIQQAEKKDITSFKPQHRNKAMMHTYLENYLSRFLMIFTGKRLTLLTNKS